MNHKNNFFSNNSQSGRFTRNNKKKIVLPGQETIELESDEYTTDANGNPEHIQSTTIQTDRTGKVITPGTPFYCKSWTNEYVTYENHGTCAMCQAEKLIKRYVCLGVDGAITENANCLCTECLIENEQRKQKAKRIFNFKSYLIY